MARSSITTGPRFCAYSRQPSQAETLYDSHCDDSGRADCRPVAAVMTGQMHPKLAGASRTWDQLPATRCGHWQCWKLTTDELTASSRKQKAAVSRHFPQSPRPPGEVGLSGPGEGNPRCPQTCVETSKKPLPPLKRRPPRCTGAVTCWASS